MIDPYCDALSDFLARDPAALRDAPAVLMPVLRGLVRRVAGDLAGAGLADEVVDETFALLLSPTVRPFDPARGTSGHYLFGAVLTAAAAVRVQHGAAGIARNDRRRRLMRDQRLVQDQSDDARLRKLKSKRQHDDPADAICLRMDVTNAMKTAPPELRKAAVLIGERDATMSQAAAAVRLDRNTLRRRLQAWATTAGLSG